MSARKVITSLAVSVTAAAGLGIATTTSSSAATQPGVQTKAQVPWSQVTDGWVAANSTKNGKNTLLLISTGGQTYTIATTLRAGEQVTAISHNGRNAITREFRQGKSTITRVWDLKAGKVIGTLPGNFDRLAFTRPTGTAIVGFDFTANQWAKFSLTGQLRTKRSAAASYGVAAPNPNGMTWATTSGTKVVLRSNADFGVVRSFGVPKGFDDCYPAGWSDANNLRLVCSTKNSTQVFRQPASGGPAVPLTKGSLPQQNGWSDVVSTSKGNIGIPNVYASPGLQQSAYVLKGTQPTTRYSAAKFNPNGGDFAGGYVNEVIADRLLVESSPLGYDSPKHSLGYLNLATNSFTYLVGNNSQFGGQYGGYAVIGSRM